MLRCDLKSWMIRCCPIVLLIVTFHSVGVFPHFSDLSAQERFEQIVQTERVVKTSLGPLRVVARQRGVETGRRIIYIHGTPGSWDNWEDYLQDPVTHPQDWSFVALDRPGFGDSDPDGPAIKLEDQARAVAAFFDSTPGAVNILIGHSYGGPVALKTALMYPLEVFGVMTVAGTFSPDLEKVYWYQDLALSPLVRGWLPRFLLNSAMELRSHRQDLEILSQQIDNLTVPVIILHGLSDRMVPYQHAELLNQSAPKDLVRLISIDDGHMLIWTSKGTIDEQTSELLEWSLEKEQS